MFDGNIESLYTMYICISLDPTSFNASPDPFGDEKQADIYALGTIFCEFVLYFNTPMEKVEVCSMTT